MNSWKQVEWGSGKFIVNIISFKLPSNREMDHAIEFILNVELVSRTPYPHSFAKKWQVGTTIEWLAFKKGK
jgi:hypothetical protein